MPSFDIVSEFDRHEAQNAVDQANREVQGRFDFRGVDASFELNDETVALSAEERFGGFFGKERGGPFQELIGGADGQCHANHAKT